MPSLYTNSFRPLASTAFGRDAAEQHDLWPFIDGSIRREPDFEHSRPVITCLCRADKFAPRLQKGDRVVYITTHGRYRQPFEHHRLIAVMEVRRLFDSHMDATAWYRSQNMPLPNNLMVRGNKANPLSHSVGQGGPRAKTGCNRCKPTQSQSGGVCPPKAKPGCGGCNQSRCGKTGHAAWDRSYQERASMYPWVAQCVHLLSPNLDWDAPMLTKPQLAEVFGKDPHTRNPGRQDIRLLPKLLRKAKLPVPPSVR